MVEKGFGVVPGRSRDKAKRLLEAAAKVKVDGALIRTTSQGYEVPVKILDAYEKSVQKDGEPDDGSIRRDKGSNPDTIPPLTAEEAIEREQAGTEDSDNESDEASEDSDNTDADEAAAAAAKEQAEKDAAAAKEAESKDKAKTASTKSTPAKAEGK